LRGDKTRTGQMGEMGRVRGGKTNTIKVKFYDEKGNTCKNKNRRQKNLLLWTAHVKWGGLKNVHTLDIHEKRIRAIKTRPPKVETNWRNETIRQPPDPSGHGLNGAFYNQVTLILDVRVIG